MGGGGGGCGWGGGGLGADGGEGEHFVGVGMGVQELVGDVLWWCCRIWDVCSERLLFIIFDFSMRLAVAVYNTSLSRVCGASFFSSTDKLNEIAFRTYLVCRRVNAHARAAARIVRYDYCYDE